MNENSTITSSGIIYCLGYIKENNPNNSSSIYINQGTLYAPFAIYVYKGEKIMTELEDKKICPFKIYDLPNVIYQIYNLI